MYFVSVGAMEGVKLSEIHVQRFCQSGALDEAFSQHQRINGDDMGVMLRCSGELLRVIRRCWKAKFRGFIIDITILIAITSITITPKP